MEDAVSEAVIKCHSSYACPIGLELMKMPVLADIRKKNILEHFSVRLLLGLQSVHLI